MGGTVAFTLRTPEGQEYRMRRWTNIMPWALTNMALVNKEPEHISEMLEQWLLMKNDYERNHKTKKFEHPMTDVYTPYHGRCLYPCDYGLIVVDMQKNKILSMQGYTSVGYMHPVAICFLSDFRRFTAFLNAGRAQYQRFDKKAKAWIEGTVPAREILEGEPLPQIPLVEGEDEAFAESPHRDLADWQHRFDDKHPGKFVFDMSPFQVETFNKTAEGARGCLGAVRGLGFALSEREEKGWERWIAWCDDGEYPDDDDTDEVS